MPISQSLEAIGEELIRSLKERLAFLETLHAEVKEALEKFNKERMEMSEKLMEVLADDRQNRIEEVNKLIDSYYQDRAEYNKAWQQTLTTMGNIRTFKPKNHK